MPYDLIGISALPPHLLPTFRMTGIARLRGKNVSGNFVVLVGKATGIVVFMAIYATELLETPRGGMAFRTLVPFSGMGTAENRKIQLVVLGKVCRLPSWVGIMTGGTIGGKVVGYMVGTFRRLEIIQVTSHAFPGRTGEITVLMTLVAIVDGMTSGEGKEQMIGGSGGPLPSGGGHVVAIQTCQRIPGSGMVRAGGRLVIRQMAVHTVIAYPVEPQDCLRPVTIPTIGDRMLPQQWKPVLHMQPHDVFHQPMVRGVATGAIVSYRHLMQVRVASITARGGFLKFQTGMAIPTIYLRMPPLQGVAGLGMPELPVFQKGLLGFLTAAPGFRCPPVAGNLPTFRPVTSGAIYPHRFPMRLLGHR